MPDPMPTLRAEIDVIPTQQDGDTIYILYDQSGITDAQLGVPAVVVFVASKLDGEHSILDIQDAYRAETGDALPAEMVAEVIEAFTDALFLRGECFDAELARQQEAFLANPVREPTSAGGAYSDDADTLARDIQAMLDATPPAEERAATTATKSPRGIIIPHIDFTRGAHGYAQAYRELAACPAPHTVIVIGTAHHPLQNRFAICPKDFGIPGGRVRHDTEATAFILDHCRAVADFSTDAFVHRGEHSVELQTVWLRHIWGDAVQIVPIIGGSIADYTDTEDCAAAMDDPQLTIFAEALRALMEKQPSTMILASADLSHIGPRFGDERELSDSFLQEVEAADRHYLHRVASGDGVAGLCSIQEQRDQYHVCGVACIQALNATLPGVRGRLLGYHQAATPEMQQAVTFASMIFA